MVAQAMPMERMSAVWLRGREGEGVPMEMGTKGRNMSETRACACVAIKSVNVDFVTQSSSQLHPHLGTPARSPQSSHRCSLRTRRSARFPSARKHNSHLPLAPKLGKILRLTPSLPIPALSSLGTRTLALHAWLASELARPAVTNSARSSGREVERGRRLSGENDRKEEVEVAIE